MSLNNFLYSCCHLYNSFFFIILVNRVLVLLHQEIKASFLGKAPRFSTVAPPRLPLNFDYKRPFPSLLFLLLSIFLPSQYYASSSFYY